MKLKKRAYVLRSTYQKLAEENKALRADIRILTDENWAKNMPEKIFITEKWRKLWRSEKLLVAMIRDYAKKHPIKNKLKTK